MIKGSPRRYVGGELTARIRRSKATVTGRGKKEIGRVATSTELSSVPEKSQRLL